MPNYDHSSGRDYCDYVRLDVSTTRNRALADAQRRADTAEQHGLTTDEAQEQLKATRKHWWQRIFS